MLFIACFNGLLFFRSFFAETSLKSSLIYAASIGVFSTSVPAIWMLSMRISATFLYLICKVYSAEFGTMPIIWFTLTVWMVSRIFLDFFFDGRA